MLELRDAELELVELVARHEVELVDERAQQRRAPAPRASSRLPRSAARQLDEELLDGVEEQMLLPRAAMRPRAPPLPALLAARLRRRARTATPAIDVDELRRRLGGQSACPPSAASAAGAGSTFGARPARAGDRRPDPRPRSANRFRLAYSGSRSFHIVSSGAAMKIDEYAPEMTPTMSANAKSFSVAPPKTSSAIDRQQRDERRGQRAADRLPQRDVRDRRERLRAASAGCSRARGRR